jgi:cysteine desulfurase/selenocysteine lyase
MNVGMYFYSMCPSAAKTAKRSKTVAEAQAFNVNKIREDFPILKTGIVYLDSTASSLTPEPVLQKMLAYYHEYRANVERGVHRLSTRASEEYEATRKKVADFINAKSTSEIIMTRNTTEGTNLVASGLAFKKGDKIVTTVLEHHSNFIIWLRVRDRRGARIEIVCPSKPMVKGILDLGDFEKAIDDRTKLVAVAHVSNVLGVVQPVKEIAEIAHEHGACVLLDAAQSVPHMRVDVQKIGCDFLAFSGHKMCAPTGSGALYMREEVVEDVEPLMIGGGSIEDVGTDYYRLAASPRRFEAGTPDIAAVIGLGAAVDYLTRIGMDKIERHDGALVKRMYDGLTALSNVEVYGPEPQHRVSIVPFNVGGLNPHDVALALDVTANIMVRSGHHCAQPLSKTVICKPGTVRASCYFYNTPNEIDVLVSAVNEIAESMAK